MMTDRALRNELVALLDGGNAHMTFEEAVAEFPLEYLNAKPPATPYSFWHFVEHMRIAQWDILEFIRNPDHVSPPYPEGYRPRPEKKADAGRWEKTLAGFRADLAALKEIVQDPSTELFEPLPHAPGYTIFREILLVADHNAYHVGELAIIRQVMGLWPEGQQYLTGAPE